MGMIDIDNADSTVESTRVENAKGEITKANTTSAESTVAGPRVAKPMENLTCLTIRTGNADCIARFYPALYQLTLIKSGIEEKVDLGFSGSRLLERLVKNPGEVVDRDELMRHAWPGRVVGQGSLNQQIYTLRQILADEKDREIIQTLPRRGYLLNPNYVDVSTEPIAQDMPLEAEKPVPQPAVVDSPSPAPQTHSYHPWRLTAMVISATSFLLFGAIIVWNATATPGGSSKLLTITYAPDTPEDLMQLIPVGEDLNRRLATQLNQPLHIVVGLHEDSLDLVCLRADGSARTLHIPQGNSGSLIDADLATCLPQ